MKLARFATGADFRKWLAKNHTSETELLVRLRKVGAPGPGITYAEALDHALCFGWIDGVRRSVDATAFSIRFTPRKPRSIWSNVNIAHVARLEKAGLMTAAGRAEFEKRDPKRSGIYAFEVRAKNFPPEYEKLFRANVKAWAYFEAQAPWYKRTATHWVVSAKKQDTRDKRLATLITDSAAQRRMGERATRALRSRVP